METSAYPPGKNGGVRSRFVVLLVCVLLCILNVSESKERSKNGCVLNEARPFRQVEQSEELKVCFGV